MLINKRNLSFMMGKFIVKLIKKDKNNIFNTEYSEKILY